MNGIVELNSAEIGLIGRDNWNWKTQEELDKTKCDRCGFPCNKEDEAFCKTFNPDGGMGK